jgi:hypothetical protein
VTDVELGQYGGRVGVYKQTPLHDPDEPAKYWLVAIGGAQKACDDLRKLVSEKMDGIENWGDAYLNKQFQNSDELGYVNHVAESNVKRMLARAADAFGVRILTTQYVDVNLDLSKQAYPSIAVPDHFQTISAILPSCPGALRGNIAQQNLSIYRECVPPHTLRHDQTLFVMEGPADLIHMIDLGKTTFADGVPACTACREPLPVNTAAIPTSIGNTIEYKKRLERVFFEGDNIHPQLVSSAYQKIDGRGDRTFIDSLVKLGWNDRENHRDRLVPLSVKVSNPFLTRPKQATVGTKHEFDE